jgi:hypothetical protein
MTFKKVCATCSSPCHAECREVAGVHIVVNAVLDAGARPCFNVLDTDLLVIPLLDHQASIDLSWAMNQQLVDITWEAIGFAEFAPKEGANILINPRDYGYTNDDVRHILVVGLGSPKRFERKEACMLFGTALQFASQIKAKKITIPVMPFRQTEGSMNLKGTAATLRCRICKEKPLHGATLHEVEVIMTPQARPYFLKGLDITKQLCATCTLPMYPDKK